MSATAPAWSPGDQATRPQDGGEVTMNVIGCLRVATREQSDSGPGRPAAQRIAILGQADRRGGGQLGLRMPASRAERCDARD
jgi:hypothetical protein